MEADILRFKASKDMDISMKRGWLIKENIQEGEGVNLVVKNFTKMVQLNNKKKQLKQISKG